MQERRAGLVTSRFSFVKKREYLEKGGAGKERTI
jgi:hypothetical protein